jgi:dihydroorotate dehydrogenase
VAIDLYQLGLRPLLFSQLGLDPELVQRRTIELLRDIGDDRTIAAGLLQAISRQWFCLDDSRLTTTVAGLTFPNPVGLAAGFDKDGLAAAMWQNLGFGFAEVGTVTDLAQSGNPQPRLFRLPKDAAALNRMGFNNRGSTAMAETLQSLPPQRLTIPLGINLGKSKVTPLEDAAGDYGRSFDRLCDCGDYFVVNVSSPNTPGLRSLQGGEQLGSILATLQQQNDRHQPIFVKIAPDLEWEAIDEAIDIAIRYAAAGIVATNTTISRDGLQTRVLKETGHPLSEEAGGISGLPVRQKSTEIIRHIYKRTNGSLPIIGVGGIFTAADAWEKITAGASLVQVYTGWLYEGPWMVSRILSGLLSRLESHSLTNLAEAIGRDDRDCSE